MIDNPKAAQKIETQMTAFCFHCGGKRKVETVTKMGHYIKKVRKPCPVCVGIKKEITA